MPVRSNVESALFGPSKRLVDGVKASFHPMFSPNYKHEKLLALKMKGVIHESNHPVSKEQMQQLHDHLLKNGHTYSGTTKGTHSSWHYYHHPATKTNTMIHHTHGGYADMHTREG